MSSRSEDLSTGLTRPPSSIIRLSTRSSTRFPGYQQYSSGTYGDGTSSFHTPSGTYGDSTRFRFAISREYEVLPLAMQQLERATNALGGLSNAIKDFPKINSAKKRHHLCRTHTATLDTIIRSFVGVKRDIIAAVKTSETDTSVPSEVFLKAYKKFRKAYRTERKALMKLCLSWDLESERATVEELKIPRARDLII